MRPLGLGETLDACFTLVRRHFKALALVVVIVTVPVEVVSFFVATSTATIQDGQVTSTNDGAYIAGQLVTYALRFASYLLVIIGCFYVVAEGYVGRDRSAAESLKFAARRSPRAAWLVLLVLLGTIAGLIFCVIPGVLFAIMWSVALPVLMVEGIGGTKAMKRSWKLVKDRWWATFGRLFIMYMIANTLASLLGIVAVGLLLAGSDSIVTYALAIALAQLISNVFTTPLIAAITVIVYFDLRVRKEAFDLAVLAEQMGVGVATATPGVATSDAVATPASEAPAAAPPSGSAPDSSEGFGGFAPPTPPPDSPESPG